MGTVYAFAIALAASSVATPLIRVFARKVGALCHPNERSIHCVPVPHLGGCAIYLSSVLAMLLVGPKDMTAMRALIFGGFVILVVGVIDDFISIKPWQKLLGQGVSAVVVIMLGVDMPFVKNPLSGNMTTLGVLAVPLTLIWVVSFENLVNLSDGLDGLAAGLVGITAGVVVFASAKAGAVGVSPLAAAIAGSVIGFLPHNFHPASIFMGDGGAGYLGLALAVLSVQGLVKSAVFMSVLAPLLTMMVPISDAAFAIVRRRCSGCPVAVADQDHLHHRLLELGMGQKKAVLSIYLVSAVFGGLGLVSGFVPVSSGILIAGVAIAAVVGVAYKAGLLKMGSKHGGKRDTLGSGGQARLREVRRSR